MPVKHTLPDQEYSQPEVRTRESARVQPEDLWPAEWVAWFHLTPQERWRESAVLRQTFLMLGGNLDPEPDTQSPFHDPQAPSPSALDGRPGRVPHAVRADVIRHGGV